MWISSPTSRCTGTLQVCWLRCKGYLRPVSLVVKLHPSRAIVMQVEDAVNDRSSKKLQSDLLYLTV